jgi:periplasmic divalent cation tolerance protein
MPNIVILVTCASRSQACKIADILLKGRLVACANIVGPVESKFWWKGKLDSSRETLLILKTAKKNFARVEKAVKRAHSYEVPEIIALPITVGSKEYLRWIAENAQIRHP